MDKHNKSNSNDDAIMTVREVALYLKLSEATVYKWAKSKRIPAIRIGHNWRFQRKAVEEWVSQIGDGEQGQSISS
jgi:excisionase family DNA binding protein